MGSFKGTSLVAVTSSAHGSSGSLDIIPHSPLGPSRRTHSKQMTVVESLEREREKGKASVLLLSFYFFFTHLWFVVLLCLPLLFFIDEWFFFCYSLSASQTPMEQIVNPLVMMWYSPYSLILFHFLLLFFLCCYVYILFFDVLSIASSCRFFFCKSRCLPL